MNWLYKGSPYNPDKPPDFYGFVYVIRFADGTVYYGKKSIWSIVRLKPLKGYKRKRKVIKESKWRSYEGSSTERKGRKIVSKEILEFANSKLHLSYLENMVLYKVDALHSDNVLNKNISGKYYSDVAERKGEWLNAN